ncbi:MAG TPA: helix-turn-helix transcriptional regulator [Candidatus Limnocylindria bacterium]
MPPSHSDRDQDANSPSDGDDRPHGRDDPGRPLTDRQLEVLGQVARGRTNRQVGEALGISERTVRNHMRTIAKRLAATDRTHAVVLAIGHGWIAVPIQPDAHEPLAQPHAAESNA